MDRGQADEEAIFNAARKIGSVEARTAYCDRACGADLGLRDRLDALLRAFEQEPSFLECPALDLADAVTLGGAWLAERHGAVIGPYELLEAIGEGGMGVVYLAEQARPVRRKVALKIIKPGMDTKQVVARFEAERQALALMDHPNIARVLDAGATGSGHPYFVMELVRGIPITDYCDQARLSIPERLELFVLVCRAVQHAHQKGVIHRDLKPSNVLVALVDDAAVPKVIDFGVAKATGTSLTEWTLVTGVAQLVGTPLYMSPEQAELSGVDVDTRSDIYSLGVLLYELLTGTTPIDRDTACKAAVDEIRRIIREQEPPRPSTRLGTLGEERATVSANRHSDSRKLSLTVRGELDWIAMKALEKDRRRRYETANDLAADVMRHLTDRPVEACPPSARYRIGKYVRRNRLMLMTAGSVVIALAAGTAVSAWQAFRATTAERRTMAALAIAARNERAYRQFWYGSQLRLTQQELSAGQVEFAQEALERLRPAAGERDLRGFEWYYLRRLAHRDVSLLFGHDSSVRSLALSPDGQTLVSGDASGVIVFWDLVAWRERARVRGHAVGVSALSFAPDGQALVSSSTGPEPTEVKLWDPATARETARIPGISGSVHGLTFSPDARTLAVCDRGADPAVTEGRVTLWNVSSGPTLATTGAVSIASAFLAVSPDHRLLATAARSGRVTLRDSSTGRATRTLPAPSYPVRGIAFTPDGRSVLVHDAGGLTFFDAATGSEDGRIASAPGDRPTMSDNVNFTQGLPLRRDHDFWLTDTRSGLRPTYLKDVSGTSLRFLFSPDGKKLSAAGYVSSAKLWDCASGEKCGEYSPPTKYVEAVAFAGRGESLLLGCGDAKIRSWHIEKPAERPDHLPGHDQEVWALAYTPDGRTLASASDDHSIRLWDARDGALRGTLTGHLSLVSSLAVSPDGSTLASGGFDNTVRLWDLPSGRARAVLGGHTDRVRGVAFSPDGRLLASSSSDRTIRLWGLAGGPELKTLRGHSGGLHDLAFDRDGTRLVSACNDGSLQVWDLDGEREPHTIPGPEARTIPGPEANLALTFTSDGSLLASGSDHGNVTIWDSRTWARRIGIKGSDAAIRELSFSPDGRTLAAACDDAKVRLWDPVTGQLTLVLDGHLRRVNAVAFCPDGSSLASASHDGAIKLWHAGSPRTIVTRGD